MKFSKKRKGLHFLRLFLITLTRSIIFVIQIPPTLALRSVDILLTIKASLHPKITSRTKYFPKKKKNENEFFFFKHDRTGNGTVGRSKGLGTAPGYNSGLFHTSETKIFFFFFFAKYFHRLEVG